VRSLATAISRHQEANDATGDQREPAPGGPAVPGTARLPPPRRNPIAVVHPVFPGCPLPDAALANDHDGASQWDLGQYPQGSSGNSHATVADRAAEHGSIRPAVQTNRAGAATKGG
jgi:hypothetical protein